MTCSGPTASATSLGIIALVLIYSFILSLSPGTRVSVVSAAGPAGGSGDFRSLIAHPPTEPSPSPSPSPEPSAQQTPEPPPPPVTMPSPVEVVPAPGLPNMDGLHNEQPVAPEVPEAPPSTICSPSQPDCNPSAQAFRQRQLSPTRRRTPSSPDRLPALSAHHSGRKAVGHASPLPQNSGSYDDFAVARLDPDNRVGAEGQDLLSRNFNWSFPLVRMAGRSGLNFGLTLSYNSLVWTRSGSHIMYDTDNGFPTPGFRLGFPTIYGQHYNSQTGKNGYLVLMPSGARVELRQVSSTNTYEAADSSYLFLVDNGETMLLRTTDGMQLSYILSENGYRCTEIKDRNGNYLTINHNAKGRITSVTDTMGRLFNFNYDANQNLSTITQLRGAVPYKWAEFGYTNLTLQTNFGNLNMVGLQNGTTLPVLSQVSLPNGTYFKFSYNSYGQVHKITHYAADSDPNYDNHPLNYVSYNLPLDAGSAQTDCPRFTERKVWAENWMSGAEVATAYSVPALADCDGLTQGCKMGQVTLPDSTVHKVFTRASGWQEGLPVMEETWAYEGTQFARRRWTNTIWTQQNTNLSYLFNPRLTETTVHDSSGNHRRTAVSYTSFSLSCGTDCVLDYYLPSETREYAANTVDVLRTTQVDYNLNFGYTSRRLFGLVSQKRIYDTPTGNALLSKVEYLYDDGGEQLVQQGTPVQHDAANYGTTNTWRGNLTRTRRYDVLTSQFVETKTGFNTTGSAIFTRDPLQTSATQLNIVYTDSFSDGQNRNSYAYPTQVWFYDTVSTTAMIVISSQSKYDYHLGKASSRKGPPAAWQSSGAESVFTYDAAGRLERITDAATSAYTRWVYPLSSNIVQQYSTINNLTSETVSANILDGAGRVRAIASEHPGLSTSTGGYTGQYLVWDAMGRLIQQTNPTEIYGSWQPAGDDAVTGWTAWLVQSYDWLGRPRMMMNQDGTTQEATYGGCGCAGGEVVTLSSEQLTEGKRRRKIYHDVLGRVTKIEELNWDQSIYRTTTKSYNALNKLLRVRQYQGGENSPRFQDSLMTYDGYGRLKMRRRPENEAGTWTTYDYANDHNLLKVTDARGAWTGYAYNNRNQVINISYGVPAGSTIAVPAQVNFTYDSVGNRMTMTDGTGSVTYSYDQSSRLVREVRTISEISQSYTLDYEYNVGGQLTAISDPNDLASKVSYAYNRTGSLTSVNAHGFAGFNGAYASDFTYRAWGAPKHIAYGSGKSADYQYNKRLQITRFEMPGVMGAEFQYSADGHIKFVNDISMEMPASNRLDRSYVFDHLGRMTAAYSGDEATTPNVETTDRPYRETFGYDEWNNLTTRTGKVWSGVMEPVEAQYTNNRRQGWEYDADGRPVLQDSLQFKYDAAGRKYESQDTEPRGHFTQNLIITQTFDGDGQRVKQQEGNIKTFYVRSTVLGGQPVSQIGKYGTGPWTKKTGFVYAGGRLLAMQKYSLYPSNNSLEWLHSNPITGSQRSTKVGGLPGVVNSELDPLGLDAGLAPPFEPEEPPGGLGGEAPDIMFPRFGDIMNGSTGCMIDGAMASCDLAMSVRDSGAGVEGPLSTTRWNPNINNGLGGYEFFHAYADGFEGWIPQGQVYYGHGEFGAPRKHDGPPVLLPPGSLPRSPNANEVVSDNEGVGTLEPSTSSSQQTPKGFPCPPDVPTIFESGRAVTSVLDATWELARKTNREEGGWIYMNKKGMLKAIPKERDREGDKQTVIDLKKPPEMEGWIVVATFHTHDYNSDPSETVPGFAMGDTDISHIQKVPGIILGGTNSGTMAFTGYGPKRGYWKSDLPKRCQK